MASNSAGEDQSVDSIRIEADNENGEKLGKNVWFQGGCDENIPLDIVAMCSWYWIN